MIFLSYVATIAIGVVSFLGLLLAEALIIQVLRIAEAPPGIPWVGLRGRWILPKLRACLSEFLVGRTMMEEGYEKYGKRGKAFILPAMHWSGVVLPPSDIAWLARQPDTILNAVSTMDDLFAFEYLTHGPSTESVHDFTAIRRNLTRQLTKVLPEVLDELTQTMDETLGRDTAEWKEFKILETLTDISFQAVNRIFVGEPYCRNKRFGKAVKDWTVIFGLSSVLPRYFIPWSLKKWLMPIAAVPSRLMQWRASRYLLPQIRERLAVRRQLLQQGSTLSDMPNDMLQWVIENNAERHDPAELAPMNIAGKLILFNVFASLTTPTMGTTVLLDILSHPDAESLLSTFREEAIQALPRVAAHDPRALRETPHLDSAIRESLRFNPMGGQGLVREVMPAEGLVAPSGTFLPRGCHVHALIATMQRDRELCGDGADVYDPLRFSRGATTTHEVGDGEDDVLKDVDRSADKHTSTEAVRLSEHFLSFGLGKHACPGRFFAVSVIKLLLGYLFVHYEVETLAERPKFLELGEAVVPKEKTTIRVRRRKGLNGGSDVEGDGGVKRD